jgi:hypothetical protein
MTICKENQGWDYSRKTPEMPERRGMRMIFN